MYSLAATTSDTQIVADLRAVKAEPGVAYLTCWSPVSLPSKTRGLSTISKQPGKPYASELDKLKLCKWSKDTPRNHLWLKVELNPETIISCSFETTVIYTMDGNRQHEIL